jgi:bifunctional ADP-heptose synthase (sugar kinase/adenylyltransferase)
MLTTAVIDTILATIPQRTIGVLGDLFLDRYLDLDAALTEPSIETGLDAYQVVSVRSYPGAAGTVINNLVALGVGRIVPIAMVGADGEGYELLQALRTMASVDLGHLVMTAERRTPTYTKPMLNKTGELPRELNRLDIKNRQPLPADVEAKILERLSQSWATFDVLLVLDQVSEPECGVVTARVRERLAGLAGGDAAKIVIVDSRERIRLFRNAWLKPNERECLRAFPSQSASEDPTDAPRWRSGSDINPASDLEGILKAMVQRGGRPVFCTRGEKGMLVVGSAQKAAVEVPAYPVAGPIDSVGAGDSSSAAMACALASRANLVESAAFGNLVASITIQQIGVTGTATPEQVRQRWRALE